MSIRVEGRLVTGVASSIEPCGRCGCARFQHKNGRGKCPLSEHPHATRLGPNDYHMHTPRVSSVGARLAVKCMNRISMGARMRKRFSWVAFFLGGAFAVALLLLGAIWSTESRRLATERSRAAAWWYVPEPKLASDSCAAFLGGQLTNVHVDADDAVGGGVSVKITGSSMETMTFHLSVDDAMRVADLIRGVAQWRAMQLSEQDGGPWL